MSGIYGFSYLKPNTVPGLCTDTLGALEYWNRIYGREAHDSRCFSDSGIGCHVEHFSDVFPHGGPILAYNGCPAVVDALLYNRDELTAAMGLNETISLSDEELLLRWIGAKGFDSLAQVNGDFSGAIYDSAMGEWILFRDHLGVRPFYYYLDDHCFAFSTDLRGLAAMPQADVSLNEMQFYIRVCGTNSLSLQETDFARIRCVLPAAVTRVRRSSDGFRLTESVYWKLRQKKIRFSSDEEYRQELRRLITDAVRRRCDAIPGILGGEFSGGLDSSVIDILVARYGREARFFSWSPDLETVPMAGSTDERRIILDICEKENMTCHFMQMQEILSYDHNADPLPMPYADTFTLGVGSAWLRNQGARVVFTGHGGDEGVSHRGRRYELFRYREYGSYFRLYFLGLAGKPFRFLRSIRSGLKDARADKRAITRALSYVRSHTELFADEFGQRMAGLYVPKEFTFNYEPDTYVMLGGTRPRMDNAAYQGALNGMRYLFPYVDYRVMDFALSIPRSQYVGPETTRVIFREAFRDLLPDALYNRNFKYQASTHDLVSEPPDLNRYYEHVEQTLSRLDGDYWGQYLNLTKLRQKLLSSDGTTGGIGSIGSLMEYLYRCSLIQNVQKNAKRWREFDEQDKTV